VAPGCYRIHFWAVDVVNSINLASLRVWYGSRTEESLKGVEIQPRGMLLDRIYEIVAPVIT
jgi:hypothetical protein